MLLVGITFETSEDLQTQTGSIDPLDFLHRLARTASGDSNARASRGCAGEVDTVTNDA